MARSDVDADDISPPHLAIIGGGIAGCAAASWASSAGARVTLINGGLPLGGSCIHSGHFPARLLMNAATDHHRAARPRFPGLHTTAEPPTWSKLSAFRRSMANELSRDFHHHLTDHHNVDLIVGFAGFIDSNRLRVGERLIEPDQVLLTPGSHSHIPTLSDESDAEILSIKALLDLEELPDRILFSETNSSAIAYAQLMARLGSKITILTEDSRLLGNLYSSKITDAIINFLQEDGVEIIENATISGATRDNGQIRATGTHKGEPSRWDTDALVFVDHRLPRIEELHLERAGIRLSERGLILTDETLQTTNERVFAAGDAIGRGLHAYASAYDAVRAAKNAISRSRTAGLTTAVPFTIYTDPQVAGVGWDEEQAAQAGFATDTSTVIMSETPASRALGFYDGFVQLCRDSRSDHLLGARIISPNASELIMEAVMAIRSGLTISELATLVHPPIALGDAISRAAARFQSK